MQTEQISKKFLATSRQSLFDMTLAYAICATDTPVSTDDGLAARSIDLQG